MIKKSDLRILNLMVEKINRLQEISSSHSEKEIENNYIYSDAVQFEFEKLYEDVTRLSPEFYIEHSDVPIQQLRGIRNRVAHDYESVVLRILLDTIQNDLPVFKKAITELIEKESN